MEKSVNLDGLIFNLQGNGVADAAMRAVPSNEENVRIYRLTVLWTESTLPEPFFIRWQAEYTDIYSVWTPRAIGTPVTWTGVSVDARLAADVPVMSFISKSGTNRCTVALSDCSTPSKIEAKASLAAFMRGFTITLFTDKTGPFSHYETDIRIDCTPVPFSEAIQNVRLWYSSLGYSSAKTPVGAFEPVYSTWYSYLQKVTQADVLNECKIAAGLGMKTVIVDDGWQKDDKPSVYGFTGDWKPCLTKFPDIGALAEEIHSLGMKFILWFSVPFVGVYAENYELFKGKYLNDLSRFDCSVLDPRYPDVRKFLVDTYVDAMKRWRLDGFKLDFIDRFKANGEVTDGMDFVSVEKATEKLLTDIVEALTALNPDVLLEFRQPYAGMVTQKFGNMFRVWDCPNDGYTNRVQVLNMRLLNGGGAVHSDMIDISQNETVESFYLQLIGTLFSVPQISFRLGCLSAGHKAALTNYLDFWTLHRETLMHGKLNVQNPELCFAYSSAESESEFIALNVSGRLFEPIEHKKNYCFNLSSECYIPVRLDSDATVTVKNCLGETVSSKTLKKGIQLVNVPLCGMIVV